MKIAFGMIVFEGDYVLKQCLEQVYPFASQILIAEGPVEYWTRRGRTTSTDRTNEILDNFYDPDKKIKIVHGTYSEKDDQCKAYMGHINNDIDYLWNLDSDEVYKTEDLVKIIDFLRSERPTSLGVRSTTFYGGFERYLTGFELNRDNFLRVFKYEPGATWLTHRPPTMKYRNEMRPKHFSSDFLYSMLGVSMYHYSYVFPSQVHNKIGYYKDSVSRDRCIDNYFSSIYLPWVNGNQDSVEAEYLGVHEFKPHFRGPCYTASFGGTHPEAIERDIDILRDRFNEELRKYNV